LVYVLSCQKENADRELAVLKSTSGYDIKGLMKEDVVLQMLEELRPYSFTVNKMGIFEFKKISDLDSVLSILSRYSNKLDDPRDIYPNDPELFAFEYYYGFNSLRNAIEREVLYLEANDMLTEFNDPDDDKIVGDEFRSILTPNRELIVDGIICVYLDSVTVGIHNYNYDALRNVHSTYSKLGVAGIAELCLQTDITTLSADDDQTISIGFIYKIVNNNSLSYQFTPKIYNDYANPNDFSYYWQFGDGQSSTEMMPIHTFATSGEFTVKLTATYNGVAYFKERIIDVGSCNANFTYLADQEVDGKYYFTNTSSVATGKIISYKWNFGDNTPTDTTKNPTHTYSSDGTYFVKLIITTNTGCSDSYEITINVSNTGNCCISCDKEIDKTKTYANGTRKVKLVFKVFNVWPIHGITSKTINFRVKSNGKLVREKADRIKSGVSGLIYTQSCSVSSPILDEVVKVNKKKASFSRYDLPPFKVRKNSVVSTYYVKDNGDVCLGVGLSLHQKDCN